MNKQESVKIHGPFEAEALRVLRRVPGLTVVEMPSTARQGDFVVRYPGSRAAVAVEFKKRANAATAWQVVAFSRATPGRPVLLIAEEMTEETRHILQDHGIAFADGLGNAHIELPGLFFHVEGRKSAKASEGRPPTRLSGRAGVAVQALLLNPKRDWQVGDLSEQAGMSVGLAHRVLARLDDEGIVASAGSGPGRRRRVTNPTALLDLWAEENVDRVVRFRGFLLAQSPRQLIDALGTSLDHAGIDYALTGAAGASLVAPFVTAIPIVAAWVAAEASPEQLFAATHAESAGEGHNVIFQQSKSDVALAFHEKIEELWVANRLRLYVDLRGDPRRGAEQAENLRREVIGF